MLTIHQMGKFIITATTGFLVGASCVGIFLFATQNEQLLSSENDQAPPPAELSPTILESEEVVDPLGNGAVVDLSLVIVNATGDESIGTYAQQDLKDAGFTIIRLEVSDTATESSTLQYKATKEIEAKQLSNWAGDDWGFLILTATLEETDLIDAILTIGTHE